jgi:hypothetical protein
MGRQPDAPSDERPFVVWNGRVEDLGGDARRRRDVRDPSAAPRRPSDYESVAAGTHGQRRLEVNDMPPRGVKKGTKRARQYEHIKESVRESGKPESTAEEIAARTVQKERARAGEARTSSRTSTDDLSSGRRGGLRSGTSRAKGRTYEQLYNEARHMNVPGRSSMNKRQLQRAVDGRK